MSPELIYRPVALGRAIVDLGRVEYSQVELDKVD